MQNRIFTNNCSNKIRVQHWDLIKIAVLILAIILCGNIDASAQGKRINKKRNAKIVGKSILAKKDSKNESTNLPNLNSPIPVTVINSAETDFLSGEASVFVNPKQPTIIRLGLSQNAVSIVEFPASDGVYYIHEGNPKLVSVFQSPTRETDRSITIYPGESFVASRSGERNLSSTITLQMRSGLILILEFVPVSNIGKNAHRCVVNYKRDEVIAARSAAGLAYNLGEDKRPKPERNTRASSKLFISQRAEAIQENNDSNLPVRVASSNVNVGSINSRRSKESNKSRKTGLELSRYVNKKLADCLKNPGKVLGKFSDEENGFSMAVSGVSEIDAVQRLVIVAVKNHGTADLRLVSGVPELQIQSADEKGSAIQIERVERTYVESTSFEGLISPGSTAYFAVVYEAPLMGADQRLRVLVSHREAADTPNSVALPKVEDAGGK